MLNRFRLSFGVTDSALAWIESYLTGRSFRVLLGDQVSQEMNLLCGVPQGSVLGTLLFILYTADVARIADAHDVDQHAYADDNEMYTQSTVDDISTMSDKLEHCVSDVDDWMTSNRFKLNPDKTEVVWFATKRTLNKFSHPHITVKQTPVTELRV